MLLQIALCAVTLVATRRLGHGYGFSSVCMFRCAASAYLLDIFLPHTLHMNPSVWALRCLTRFFFKVKVLGHLSHLNTVPLWLPSCLIRSPLWLKDLVQPANMHWCLTLGLAPDIFAGADDGVWGTGDDTGTGAWGPGTGAVSGGSGSGTLSSSPYSSAGCNTGGLVAMVCVLTLL